MTMTFERRETILSVQHVAQRIDGVEVLSDVTFDVRDLVRPGLITGQVVALLGRSGTGKTRLLRILAGLDEPCGGSVLVGADAHPVRRGEVGFVFQDYPLFEHRTVLGNLRAADPGRAACGELLARFGLEACAGRYPSQLSGGQRQRVAILQQVLSSRHFLLMDEPLSGLDPIAVDEVCALVRDIVSRDELNTVILTTHNVESAITIADTILLLAGGVVARTYDLVERGLAWREPAERELAALRREIREDFGRLTVDG